MIARRFLAERPGSADTSRLRGPLRRDPAASLTTSSMTDSPFRKRQLSLILAKWLWLEIELPPLCHDQQVKGAWY
jgi:hypothetical protein